MLCNDIKWERKCCWRCLVNVLETCVGCDCKLYWLCWRKCNYRMMLVIMFVIVNQVTFNHYNHRETIFVWEIGNEIWIHFLPRGLINILHFEQLRKWYRFSQTDSFYCLRTTVTVGLLKKLTSIVIISIVTSYRALHAMGHQARNISSDFLRLRVIRYRQT